MLQMYQESFIRNNPAKFVDTEWVNVDDLKSFLSTQEVHLNIYTSCDLFMTWERKNLWHVSVTTLMHHELLEKNVLRLPIWL